MTLPEYYHYLQQLPQQIITMLQQRYAQQNTTRHTGHTKPAAYKKKLARKTFLPTRKPR